VSIPIKEIYRVSEIYLHVMHFQFPKWALKADLAVSKLLMTKGSDLEKTFIWQHLKELFQHTWKWRIFESIILVCLLIDWLKSPSLLVRQNFAWFNKLWIESSASSLSLCAVKYYSLSSLGTLVNLMICEYAFFFIPWCNVWCNGR
jgi:hypothetical protein